MDSRKVCTSNIVQAAAAMASSQPRCRVLYRHTMRAVKKAVVIKNRMMDMITSAGLLFGTAFDHKPGSVVELLNIAGSFYADFFCRQSRTMVSTCLAESVCKGYKISCTVDGYVCRELDQCSRQKEQISCPQSVVNVSSVRCRGQRRYSCKDQEEQISCCDSSTTVLTRPRSRRLRENVRSFGKVGSGHAQFQRCGG